MLSIFKSRPVGHLQAVTLAHEQLDRLKSENYQDFSDLERLLTQIKEQLYQDSYYQLPPMQHVELEKKLIEEEFLNDLIIQLNYLNCSCKRLSIKILQYCLKLNKSDQFLFINYLKLRPQLIFILFHSYEDSDPQQSVELLRHVLRHPACFEPLLTHVNSSNEIEFFNFFKFIQFSTLDLSCHSFQTFKDCIRKYNKLMVKFIWNNYDQFFSNYYQLILNSNYVIKRQSLKLLGEFLLDRLNFKIMTKLMNDVEYLKLMMNYLKDPSKNIQWEAFHIFKIFVANPKKEEPIKKILKLNQFKLIQFLNQFQQSKLDDEKFVDEKDYIILQIQSL